MTATASKRAIILMNLGSPDSTEVKDVRKYLNEFLMDERVIDSSYLVRTILVKGIISPFRAPKSAEAYKKVWTKDGSPLIVLTRNLQNELQKQLHEPVEIAMRYGNPSIKTAFDNLNNNYPGLEEVILVPLYPHYAQSSYETAVVDAEEKHKAGNYKFKITTIKPFYNDDNYINALSESIKPYLQSDYDQILFSYHGLPERHMKKADVTGSHCMMSADCCSVDSAAHAHCYRHQVFVTTDLVAAKLGIPKEKFRLSFQSRLGREEWLKPYTALLLPELPKQGIKKLLVVCPAFVSDCLETLEEMEMQGKEAFLAAGGESYTLIPCLNTHPLWIKTVAGWIEGIVSGKKEMVLQ